MLQPLLYILFCESPLCRSKVDDDFEDEMAAAQEKQVGTLLFSYEDLCDAERAALATRRIRPAAEIYTVVYRGWMLRPEEYAVLYEQLLAKNYKLVNTPTEYQNCHYLPDSLKYISENTPHTIYEHIADTTDIERLIARAADFGHNAVVVKDYVKSEKHHWNTACFVPDALNTDHLRAVIGELLRLRGKYLNEGIVIRQFVQLHYLTMHSKSGTPLAEEYRLFFCNGRLAGVYNYWEEGEYGALPPDTELFEAIARTVESNFFSMDIARQANGAWTIIELGDGQVSGVPEGADVKGFYEALVACWV